MHRKKIICLLTGTIFLISMIFLGCSPAKKPTPTPTKNVVPITPRKVAPAPIPTSPLGPPANADRTREITKIQKLTQKINALPGVKSCTVVVSGKTAYVGLKLAAGANKQSTENLVSSKVLSSEPTVRTVYVTSDPTMFARLKKVNNGFTRGKPITDYAGDLTAVSSSNSTRRVTR